MRSFIALTEAGVIIEKGKDCPPLDVRSEGRELQIPPLCIDDYKGTLFRNMVAFEQCHRECRPDVTSYLFFFDGLINSADDVELLHHKEVIQHSLGSNKEVATLVNSHYFSHWVVGISTVAGIIVLYLTLLQTGCTVSDHSKPNTTFLEHIKYRRSISWSF